MMLFKNKKKTAKINSDDDLLNMLFEKACSSLKETADNANVDAHMLRALERFNLESDASELSALLKKMQFS